MYVIQPAWLAEVGILPFEIDVEIYSKFDEPGFRFTSPKLPTRWVVTPTRVQIESDKPNEDCGSALAKVLEKLPWTPIAAVGNNALYRAPLDEVPSLPFQDVFSTSAVGGFTVAQRAVGFGLKRGDTRFNVNVATTEDEIELSVNAHTECRGHKSEYAQRAVRNFFADRKTGEELIADLFKASVIYADRDDAQSKGIDRGNGESG